MKKFLFSFGIFAFVIFTVGFLFPQLSFAATRTWDGGGSTNNWSEAANWSDDTAPVAADTATFNATSTKNATIDQAFSVTLLQMNTGYTGTITQAADLTHSGASADFVHDTTDGAFIWQSGTLTFANNTASTWDVDTDDVFGNVTFSKGNNPVVVSLGDTAVVTGTLTLSDGTISTGIVEARGPVVHAALFDGGVSTGALNITQGDTDIELVAGGQMPITTLSANRNLVGSASGTVQFDGLLTIANGTYVGSDGVLTLVGGLTVSAGSFNGGSGNIDNNGAFVLSGGTFTSTTGTFFNASTWTHTAGGTFTHNSGTVTFDGGSGTSNHNVDTSETFYNLTLNPGGGTKTLAAGDAFIVTGTLTLSNGNFGGGTIDARGPIVHGAAFDGGAGGIIDITAGSDDINLTAGGQMPAVVMSTDRIINGVASGSVSFDARLTLAAGSFVGGVGDTVFTGLTVSGGTFSGGSGTLDVNSTFILSAGTFTATTGNLSVTDWTHTAGGTFIHNSGTVIWDGGSTTANVDVTETFHNFNIDATGGFTKTVTTGDTLVVEGTLTLTDGVIANGTIEARGPIVHTAAFNGGSGATLTITQGDTDINLVAGGQMPATTLSVDRTINGASSGTVTFDGALTIADGNFVAGAGDITINGPGLVVSGGTFTGGVGTLTVAADFTLSGTGVFTAPSGIFSLGDQWTHTDSGTFNHNSGTVVCAGTGNGGSIWDVDVTETFNNFTISAPSINTGLNLNAADTIIVLGTLTLTNGKFNTTGATIDARGPVVPEATFDGGVGTINITAGSTDIALVADGVLPAVTLSTGRTISAPATGTVTMQGRFTVAAGTYTGSTSDLVAAGLSVTGGAFNGGSGNIDNNQTFILSGTGTTFTATSGTMYMANTWTHTDASIFNHNSGSVEFDSTNNVTINVDVTETFYNLAWNMAGSNNARSVTAGDTLIVLGTLNLTEGSVGSSALAVIQPQGNVVVSSGFDGGGTALVFAGSNVQTFTLTGATDLYNGDIRVEKTGGQVNLTSDLIVNANNQDFVLVEGKLNIAGYDLTVNGAGSTFVVQDGGNLHLYGNETFTVNASLPTLSTGSTVTYTGDGDALADTYTVTTLKAAYHHLTINSTDGATDTFQLGSALDVNGNFTLTTGTFDVVSGQNYAVNLAGNWSNSGTFMSRSGTVTLDGADQSISDANTFYNFTKATSTMATLTLPASVTQTFLGTLTLTGMSTTQRLSLVSSTPGVKAKIDPQGPEVVDYLSVMDSDNDSLTAIVCSTSCVDAGNNENWTLPAAAGGSTPVIIVTPITIAITRPNVLGLKFTPGQKVNITWTSTGVGIAHVDLFFSADDGISYSTIVEKERNDGGYVWTVPSTPTTKGRLLIKGSDGALVVATDVNDKVFTIIPPPVVVVPTPVVEPVPTTPVVEPVVVTPIVETPTTTPVTETPTGTPVTSWPAEPLPTQPVWEPMAGTYVTSDNASGVYYVEEHSVFGLVLRPFLTPQSFFTHQLNFDNVETVPFEQLSALSLDGIMLPKPGVVLVKLATDERVYALETSGEQTALRWIVSEELAAVMYGENWTDYVLDINPLLWEPFAQGEPITEPIEVDMSIMRKRVDLHL